MRVRIIERAVLQDAITYAIANNIDTLLCSELSRLGRNAFEVLETVKRLVDNRINLYLQKEQMTLLDDNKEPDDNQSMTHLLMNTDRFELEGLISSPSFGDGHKEEILRMIDIYEQDYPVLKQHARLMSPKALRPLVKQGRMSEAPACGYGEPTEGSEWINGLNL